MTNWLWIGASTLLCLQWIVIHLSGIHPSPEWQSLSAGLAIFGAAFMLSCAIELEPQHKIEILYLGLATIYSFSIPFKEQLDLLDAAVFISIFVFYMRAASRAVHVEPEIEGPAEMIVGWGEGTRRVTTVIFFPFSGFTIFIAAEPFAEGLLATGRTFGIEEFILVQWLAPLASESPEFIVAILFALRAQPGTSMGALLSSKVNQWTLLVGMLPVVYAVPA